MLKTNQYQLPFLYHNQQGVGSGTAPGGGGDRSIPKNFNQQHPNLFINTEHHPSLHRADSYKPNQNVVNHRHSFSTNSQTIKEHELSDTESEQESEDDDDDEEVDLKNEEDENDYCYGGYHPVEINEVLNQNYKILRKLGWGHFSTVWLAYDKRNDNHVAIKIVRSQSHYTQAALDEIKILEIINNKNPNHPGFDHLIKLHDWFYHNGPNGKHVCMVFEVLGENMLGLINKFGKKGSSETSSTSSTATVTPTAAPISIKLSNIEKSYGGLPVTVVKQISKQILLALDYLHRECGLIHTDIKPENILLEIKNVEKFVKLLKIDQSEKKKSRSRSSNNSNINSTLQQHVQQQLSQHPASLSSQKRRKSSAVSINNSPIKCSKPLPSPLTTSATFDFQDYFSSYTANNQNNKNTSQTSKNSSSSAGSIKCYDDESAVFSSHQNQSTSPATSSNLTSCVVCASETNSEDEEDDDNEDDDVNYTYNDSLGLNTRFSSISIDDSEQHSLAQSSGDLSSIINVKLADLGNACFNNLHFTNDIQTRQYRAPEILLGHKWGCSTDIWSTACLIFELITGDYLFDPKNGKNYTKDDDHIAQILELIDDQDVSYQFMMDCKYSLDFFHSDYKTLRRIKNLKYWDLKNVLIQKYKMNEDLAQEINDFLSPMLKIDPHFRVDAGGWSNHDWLDDVKNCAGFINRPCGCCGEDIKGWDKRCKD